MSQLGKVPNEMVPVGVGILVGPAVFGAGVVGFLVGDDVGCDVMDVGVTGAEVIGAEVTGAKVTGIEVTGAEVTGAEVTGALVGGFVGALVVNEQEPAVMVQVLLLQLEFEVQAFPILVPPAHVPPQSESFVLCVRTKNGNKKRINDSLSENDKSSISTLKDT